MKKIERVFLIILDSVGVGELPDAASYGDEGSDTLRTCYETGLLKVPTMEKMGLFQIDGLDYARPVSHFGDEEGIGVYEKNIGSYGKMIEKSAGKDTTVGHWEIAGIISARPLPTYPHGFPPEVIKEFEGKTGHKALCNLPYSGTEVLKDYGEQHLDGGGLIVYTSADSVFQVAAHEGIVPIEELYRVCEIARNLLQGEHGVGRVIARPFEGSAPNFKRTARRKDFSIAPPRNTVLNLLQEKGVATIGVGKIEDIFSGSGIAESVHTKSNRDGMAVTKKFIEKDFNGLCFVNLVDFDMLYGHRNDVLGYVNALNEFDEWLGSVIHKFRETDLLLMAADHGCDPAPPGTDHTREYIPILAYGAMVKGNNNLGIRDSFADIGKTIADIFSIESEVLDGESMLNELLR